MGITVGEALKLKGLDRAKLIAGERGIGRFIKRVSVIECPESPELFTEGDFFITAFFALKGDDDAQLSMIKALVEAECSGLCIIDMYLSDLSETVKRFADEARFPVMILPNDVPYAEIITNVMDAIIKSKDDIINEMNVDTLLAAGKTEREIIETAKKINASFKDKITAAFYENASLAAEDVLKKLKNSADFPECWSLLKYKKGVLTIMSFGNESKKSIDLRMEEFLKAAERTGGKYRLGIGNLHPALSQINLCIKEALLANDAARAMGDKNIVFYKDLGIYRLLMLLKNEPELKNYMNEIINPVEEYDRKYRTRLLDTVISYVENDGDISRTAEALFLHVNTIRYRIQKVREILHMEHLEGGFYEQISMAVKIHKLYK
ncbi:MAG: PucR family transcriptional regulator ligand-binding domain-containing protein [Tepidanaerobacteraceae bacterium]|jgi:hypothetical protein|nr:PucR family transcriptional regulator ligand-binding domain-containing protein [Tepidanaerobacteraceae bacterium]